MSYIFNDKWHNSVLNCIALAPTHSHISTLQKFVKKNLKNKNLWILSKHQFWTMLWSNFTLIFIIIQEKNLLLWIVIFFGSWSFSCVFFSYRVRFYLFCFSLSIFLLAIYFIWMVCYFSVSKTYSDFFSFFFLFLCSRFVHIGLQRKLALFFFKFLSFYLFIWMLI